MALLNEAERIALGAAVHDLWMYTCKIYDATIAEDANGKMRVAIGGTPRESVKCSLTVRRASVVQGVPPVQVYVETQVIRLPRTLEPPEERSVIDVYDADGVTFVGRFEVANGITHDHISYRVPVRSVTNEAVDEYTV